MNIYIAISQSARILAIWTKKHTTKQILLTVSTIAYTALLMKREEKINRYYDEKARAEGYTEPRNSDRKNP